MKGWFHRVKSKGEKIFAINYWFNNIENICDQKEDYLIKYLINEKVERGIKDRITKIILEFSEEEKES